MMVLLLMSLGGCLSVQWEDKDGVVHSLGLLHYSVVDTESAQVFVHQTLGLDLRLTSFDGGITLGYRKYIAVQPCAEKGCVQKSSQGFFRAEDQVTKGAGLFLRKSLGTELGLNPTSNGLRLGLYKQTLIVGPTFGESNITKIDFYENAPDATTFIRRREQP